MPGILVSSNSSYSFHWFGIGVFGAFGPGFHADNWACVTEIHLYALEILELSMAGYSIASRGHMVVPASHFGLDPLVCFPVF